MRTLLMRFQAILFLAFASQGRAQGLELPPCPTNSPSGAVFAQRISSLDLGARDRAIADAFFAGNVPDFLRHFCPVTVTNVSVSGGDATTNAGTFFVAPDYLAIGSDTDYFFAPISPGTAQGIADKLDCILPTPKMVDAIYATAQVKLPPSPIPPSAAMTTVPVFVQLNQTIWSQRMALTNLYPLGALVAGHKKDVVISRRLSVATNNVAIYGWQRTNGAPIQPLYLGHAWWWVDYSQGIRLVAKMMLVNGKEKSVADVLADPRVCGLISDEGVVTNARYRTSFKWPDKISLAWPAGFSLSRNEPSPHPNPLPSHPVGAEREQQSGEIHSLKTVMNCQSSSFHGSREWTREIETLDGVRILINAPDPEAFSTDKPVELVFYALPNGNTIEETIGRKLSPGRAIGGGKGKSGQSGSFALPDDDWRFDIQHIGAQTRWLRQVITNKTLVVAYLQADTKSWPAWRKTHSDPDRRIAEILNEICGIFPSNRTEIVLTSHSGGGSLVFGYLDAVDEIPANVRRIAFLDSDYDYDSGLDAKKLMNWLAASSANHLCVLAYQDYLGLYNGKPFVSEAGGTWGRSRAMLEDFSIGFSFTSETNSGLEIYSTANRQIEYFLKENPDHKILHTVQVERNGFIQALLSGTALEGQGYQYFGERVYTNWIEPVDDSVPNALPHPPDASGLGEGE